MIIKRNEQIKEILLANLLAAHEQICKDPNQTPKEILKFTRGVLKLSNQIGDKSIDAGTEINKEWSSEPVNHL